MQDPDLPRGVGDHRRNRYNARALDLHFRGLKEQRLGFLGLNVFVAADEQGRTYVIAADTVLHADEEGWGEILDGLEKLSG